MAPQILVVDDEPAVTGLLAYNLRKEGYDARTFWERLKKTGPAEILTIEGDDGERIQVWIE